MKFRYRARTKEGEAKTGFVEASSKEAALALLQRYDLFITLLEKTGIELPFYSKKVKIFEMISQKDLVMFSRQLAIMFKSKVSLTESLNVLSSQAKNQALKEKILTIAEQVQGGTSFSQAISQFPENFSTFYVSMIRSGEASGKLAESLEYLADHLEREYYLRAKTTGALIYPILIVITMIAVLVIIMTFVVPQLSELLKENESELPLSTKIVMKSSEIMAKWWWAILLALGGLAAVILRYLKTKEGKELMDRTVLRLPAVGSSIKTVYLGRFAENLATLITGGIPISRALEITADIIGNSVYRSIILQARSGVEKGETISATLLRYPDVFPPVFTQMVRVGEKSGALDTTLMQVVGFYRKEVEQSIENILNILEPVMIIILGLVVGGLVGSILIPFYKIMGGL
ncbi:MAG: type II secretion system F family protein [Candidatus Nealsonbacteria bacterium]|nr:type II secretion system F family protein [Candidatus Nealsonbacteria bacterium]